MPKEKLRGIHTKTPQKASNSVTQGELLESLVEDGEEAEIVVPSIPPDHQDYERLKDIADALLEAADGSQKLQKTVGEIVRDCIDRVIQTPKTGRRFFTELQNSEKTYIGTAFEIDLRSALGLSRGAKMDLEIAGHDVDVKFTTGKGGWMIPPETVGQPCIVVSANETTSRYSLGIVVARDEYLNPGKNRDMKRTIRAAHREHIWWLVKEAPYPENFWLTVSGEAIKKISAGRSGNERMMTLFREVLDKPISRKIIVDVAQQLDPTRRVRADKSRGTRNVLDRERILVLSGSKKKQRALIKALGLPEISSTEYLAHKFSTDAERKLAARYSCAI